MKINDNNNKHCRWDNMYLDSIQYNIVFYNNDCTDCFI